MRIVLPPRWPALVLAALLAGRAAHATTPPWNAPVPPELRAAFAAGLFDVPGPPAALGTSAVQPVWNIPIIRVAFTDSALVHGAGELTRVLFDTTGANPAGSVTEYYDQISGHRVRIRGEVVATVQLPFDRLFYSGNAYGLNQISTPHNVVGAIVDALGDADATVDWNRFDMDHDGYVDMLWIVHAGYGAEQTGDRRNFWSLTSRLSGGWLASSAYETDDLVQGTETLRMKIDRFSVMPELTIFHPGAISEIGIYAHEFGHALGLPDLYDTSSIGGSTGNQGPGDWSIMGTGTYGGNNQSPERPTGMGAWALVALGWAPRLQVTADTTLSIAPAAQGGPVLDVWFEGEDNPEHFLIENRQLTGYDQNLPSPGLLLWQAEETVIGRNLGSNRINSGPVPGLRVVEGDGDGDLAQGQNRGDANDPLPGALGIVRVDDETIPAMRSLSGAPTNLSLENIRLEGGNVIADIRVRAAGWRAPVDLDPLPVEPVPPTGPAVRGVHLPSGSDAVVVSERAGGVSQVRLRERSPDGTWLAPVTVSNPALQSSDPSVARLTGDDLAIVWSEAGPTGGAIRYRARIAGTWTTATTLSTPAENGRWPSVAADPHGRVVAAWFDGAAVPRLRMLRFLYASPFGTPATITQTRDVPTAPLVVSAPSGLAYVIWIDNGISPAALTFVRAAPDSAPTPSARLLSPGPYAHRSFGAALDSLAVLHLAWQVSVPGASEIHYQRRPQAGNPVPRDTLLDARGDAQRDPQVKVDPQGNVHLVWQRTGPEGLELRYLRSRPGLGWDFRPTRVTPPGEDGAQATLLPRGYADLGVVYVATGATGERLRERSRSLGLAPVVSVAGPAPRAPLVTLQCAPNPIHAGGMVLFRAPPGTPWLGVYDALGRRLARVELDAEGRGRLRAARAEWRTGLYFVHGPGAAAARLVVLD